MEKIFRKLNLHRSANGLLNSTSRNPKSLTRILLFHGYNQNLGSSDSDLELDFENPKRLSSNPTSQRISEERLDRIEVSKAAGELKVRIDPWPEWVDFIACLSKKGYFEGDGVPFLNSELGAKDFNRIRTACLDFARDRSNLIRCLSRKELHVIAGYGCPTTDRKVVNSGKRLRAHVGIDEENVCSSCDLRGECERAYAKSFGDGVLTVDVMRLLLSYWFDHISANVENKHCLNNKAYNSVRKLFKEIAEYSSGESESDLLTSNEANAPATRGDWHCSKCNFLNFSRNVKCLRCGYIFLERLRKRNEDQADLPLKKGDWVCDKCHFLNFAKNSRCLECKEKPLNRQLNPGEWECESCNYINFRKNTLCLKCDHQRPKALNTRNVSARPAVSGNGNYSSSKRTFSYGELVDNAGKRASSKKHDGCMWRFAESESEDHVDFKIFSSCDESDSDQSIQRQEERWKLEKRKKKENAIEKEDDLILRSDKVERRYEFESTDDEDIIEWFGHKPRAKR